jgi:hypothetical protein
MKRFRFPLERVRRWRSEQLGVEELKLQQVRAERQALASAKTQVQNDLAKTEGEVLSQPSLEALDLQSLDSFRHYIRGRVRDIENREQQMEEKVVAQRQRVIEARRQFELLDRLHQKALTEWRTAADTEQETLAAEMFLAKSIRNA